MVYQPDISDETLNRLLQEAAAEKDRARWIQLLRRINRIRAERWLNGPQPAHRDGPVPNEMDTFDIFSGVPDAHAHWIERVTVLDQARHGLHELAAENPGEYFLFQPHTRTVISRVNSHFRQAYERTVAS